MAGLVEALNMEYIQSFYVACLYDHEYVCIKENIYISYYFNIFFYLVLYTFILWFCEIC